MCRTRAALLCLACLLPLQAAAATIVVNNLDAGTGAGFDDPTPVSPVAGNPATTLGGQRLAAFQAAADDWGATLVSNVTIVVDAEMVNLECTQDRAVLGLAGPMGSIASDFAGAPFPGTWYPQAMVNAFTGSDIDPEQSDIGASFNKDIGTAECLEAQGWSYVIGQPAPAGTIPFTSTVLHELGHGLGFLTFVDLATGEYCCVPPPPQMPILHPDHFSRFLLDETPTPTLWPDLSDSGRADSAIEVGDLTWAGARVADVTALLTAGRHGTSGRVQMYAPPALQPGSSVSHFDIELSPDELMEPFLQEPQERRLTNHLMLDLGWRGMVALAVTNTDGRSTIAAGSPTTYVMTLTHNGPADITVTGANVTDTLPAALTGATWTCTGAGGAFCANANGAGDISTSVTVPLGGTITFTLDATVSGGFSGTLSNTMLVALPAFLQNTVGSEATDATAVGADLIFKDGFE